MRVVVTGASGFTGQYVTAELDRRGIDWLSLCADLTDPQAIDAEIAATQFDRIIHLAGMAFTKDQNWRAFYAVNHIGTLSLLEAVAKYAPSARCILASSAQVYGSATAGLINENSHCFPSGHYALSKYGMEISSSMWRNDLDIVVVRPFNYTGIGQELRYLVPKIVDHFKRRADTIDLGNIEVRRDFGDVRIVASVYCDLITMAEPVLSPINICTGRITSISEIVNTLEGLTGHTLRVVVDPAFVRENDVEELGGDASRLRSICPNLPAFCMSDTLTWMLNS